MRVLVIMPTFNESGNIIKSVEQLFTYNPTVDLLIVDDNSPDGTGEMADQLAKSNSQSPCYTDKKKMA